jgi:type IV pilus assembly protein PilY1
MKVLPILFLLLCFLFTGTSFAHDTDLYMAQGEGVEPNLLIMFDNSGSMGDEVQAYFYNPATLYPALVVPQANRNTVYYLSGATWKLFANDISNVACAAARTALTNTGHYEGNTNSTCKKTYQTLQTGNYRNYLQSIGGDEYLPKIDIAKRVITDFVTTINGIRVGVMKFNSSEGGRLQSVIKSLNDATRTELIDDVNAIDANTWTPLAETLYEAGLYFKGGNSKFNAGVVYTSPIQFSCQRNYVIIITDGESTEDRNAILGTVIGDRDGDIREPIGAKNDPKYASNGSDYLDDVANYLYATDLRSDTTGTQNVITYTIGFTFSSSLLERTATQGHGLYFYANNVQNLASSFQNVIDEILSKSTSFVAPIVPVSRMERTTAGDKIYLALFKPLKDQIWSGNVKKFGVAQANNPASGIVIGDILDANGSKALGSDGQFFSTASSYWSGGVMDGGEVEKGGVGQVLLNRATARNLYTYLGSNASLLHSSNAFITSNGLITPTLLGLPAGDNVAKNELIQFMHGLDSYDENGNGNMTEKRDWILGGFLHSRPMVIHYATRSVIFVGSNDGMLHAFDDSDGTELWGFVPPNLFTKLQALHADVVEFFVDGSPRAYVARNPDGSISQAILVFGERRGGNRFYALDITDPLNPRYLWDIGPSTLGFEELGDSWSTPAIGEIAYGTGEKRVVFIGGGYDENQDNSPVAAADTKGRAVYAVDLLTGARVWRYSHAEDANMSYSIPSDVATVDTDADGRIERLYVGDMGGRMWRFDTSDTSPSNWTGKILFQSNGVSNNNLRKIFYPPDVSLEKDTANYEMLFFGTGDREDPREETVINRLYAVKDKNPTTALTETDLVDVTQDLLQDPATTQEQKNSIKAQLSAGLGWYIKLDLSSGEKCLAAPVTFNRIAFFTTYSPGSLAEGDDPCFVGEGVARLYVLQYTTGNAVFNFDATNDTDSPVIARSDRVKTMGTGIPSGVIITFIQGTAVAYAGVGGGVFMPTFTDAMTKSLLSVFWQTIF